MSQGAESARWAPQLTLWPSGDIVHPESDARLDDQFWLERLLSIRQEIREIDAQTRQLSDRREVLVQARKQAERRAYGSRSKLDTRPDNEYVLVEEIRPYVDRAIEELGQVRIFAKHAGVSERLVRRIRNTDKRYVSFKAADRLLIASGVPHVLSELRTYPPGVVNGSAYSSDDEGLELDA